MKPRGLVPWIWAQPACHLNDGMMCLERIVLQWRSQVHSRSVYLGKKHHTPLSLIVPHKEILLVISLRKEIPSGPPIYLSRRSLQNQYWPGICSMPSAVLREVEEKCQQAILALKEPTTELGSLSSPVWPRPSPVWAGKVWKVSWRRSNFCWAFRSNMERKAWAFWVT